jgi:uncharacterized protein YbjT (DUF2867 family)
MIVVATPTGLIGHKVLDNVFDSAEPIRVIARDPSRLPQRVRERVEVVQGSLTDIEVVTRALAGVDSVFWLLPPNPRAESVEGHMLDFTRPLCEALTSQGVRRLIYISGLGREVARDAAGLAVDDLITSTGVSYRALRCPAFMDNLLQQLGPIKGQGMFFYPISGDRKLPTCATRDIAAVAARLLLDLLGIGSHELARIHGQDHLRAGIAGGSLSIESRRVEPEEDVGIEKSVPFGWGKVDQAGCQGRWRHGPLIPQPNPVR